MDFLHQESGCNRAIAIFTLLNEKRSTQISYLVFGLLFIDIRANILLNIEMTQRIVFTFRAKCVPTTLANRKLINTAVSWNIQLFCILKIKH